MKESEKRQRRPPLVWGILARGDGSSFISQNVDSFISTKKN